MSRSLGLREDQREGEVLATLIFGLFPVDPVRCIREQARTDADLRRNQDQPWGVLAKRPEQLAKI